LAVAVVWLTLSLRAGHGGSPGSVAQAGAADVGEGDIEVEFSVPPAPAFMSDEGGGGPFAAELERRFPGLRYSAALSLAAEQCARFPARLGQSVLPGELVEAAACWAGCPDPSPNGLAVLSSEQRDDEVWAEISRILTRRGAGFTHVGLARVPVVESRFKWCWVALFVARRVNLQPVSRQLPTGGTLPVAFSLRPGYGSPQVVTTWPNGSLRRAPVREREGAWRAVVQVSPEPGEQLLEIIATSPRGPEVVALMPLSVGTQPRGSWVGRIGCPETEAVLTVDEAEKAILALANGERRTRGLAPLELDRRVAAVARAHSREMADAGYFAHVSPSTGELADRLHAARIAVEAAAENIGKAECLASVHGSLMESPGHRANLLSPLYTHVGVGVAVVSSASGTSLFVVTQDFVRPRTGNNVLP
jgi:uncharacterized protein YkwD